MKTVIDAKKDVVAAAADRIQCLVAEKPGAVLALAAGRTMEPLFAELAERCKKGELQMADCRVFSVTEYVGAPTGLSCRHVIEEKLLNVTDLREENCCFLDEVTLEDYDARITAVGGLDLAVLGIGINAQIGFNEPVALFNSLTHRQKLSEVTRQQKAEQFGGLEAVPEYGLTMGVKTLILAREILLLAFGEEKAEAVFRMLYARNDGVFPAAFLELHAQAAAYLDEAAAAKL